MAGDTVAQSATINIGGDVTATACAGTQWCYGGIPLTTGSPPMPNGFLGQVSYTDACGVGRTGTYDVALAGPGASVCFCTMTGSSVSTSILSPGSFGGSGTAGHGAACTSIP